VKSVAAGWRWGPGWSRLLVHWQFAHIVSRRDRQPRRLNASCLLTIIPCDTPLSQARHMQTSSPRTAQGLARHSDIRLTRACTRISSYKIEPRPLGGAGAAGRSSVASDGNRNMIPMESSSQIWGDLSLMVARTTTHSNREHCNPLAPSRLWRVSRLTRRALQVAPRPRRTHSAADLWPRIGQLRRRVGSISSGIARLCSGAGCVCGWTGLEEVGDFRW
jgi:hypothetical protein